ncbi:MAG: hypothetical protein M0R03_13495 [Novosphingobium sp.]|nr:hypothetical protein [Novosphingobium sp.]
MKKVIVLTLSMLMINSFVINADTNFDTARSKVYGASQRLQQQQQEQARLNAEIKREISSLSQIQGNPEYASDFQSRQERIRSLVNQHNSKVDECKSAVDYLGKEISQVSSRYIVDGTNSNYNIRKANFGKLDPIIHDVPTNTNHYKKF